MLVVEDNEVNAEVIARLLASIGVRSRVATDGQEGIDALAAHAFDAVLMDCSMPRLDGFEATRRIRARERAEGLAHTPVIGLSAHTVQAIRAACLEAGMDDVRGKPVTVRDLRDALCPYLPGCLCENGEADGEPGRDDLPPILDETVFGELRAQLGEGMASFGNRLIDVFADSAARDIAAIDSARREGELDRLAFHAHRLKGSSATVGASGLHCAARRADEAARRGDAEVAGAAAGRLDEIFAVTLRELAALPWRSRLGTDDGGGIEGGGASTSGALDPGRERGENEESADAGSGERAAQRAEGRASAERGAPRPGEHSPGGGGESKGTVAPPGGRG